MIGVANSSEPLSRVASWQFDLSFARGGEVIVSVCMRGEIDLFGRAQRMTDFEIRSKEWVGTGS